MELHLNSRRGLIVHIGDGIIGYLDGAELKIASLPDNGEFSNVTTFVTSNEAAVSMRLFSGLILRQGSLYIKSN
ncbi:MAG: protein phosphatase 2C domain-containing protein [Synergistaceae bacterium]|nr:protein phosphatase 2C domain-containing protein [Synergistaceae bacterium]